MLGTYHLGALFDILNKIHFVYEPAKLWSFVLDQTCKTLQAEAASFFQIGDDEKEMNLTATSGVDIAKLVRQPFKVGVGICGWVAQYHQPALVPDARTDNRFNRQVDAVTGFQTKSILCVPIFSQKRSYGVIEILNKKTGAFNPQDQEFMMLLGRQAAVAYQNLLLIEEVTRTKTLFESLTQNMSGGLIAIDQKNNISVMNPSASRLLALPESGCVGKPAAVVLMDTPWITETLQSTVQSRETVSRQEKQLSLKGQDIRLGYTTILITDRDGAALGAGMLFQKLS